MDIRAPHLADAPDRESLRESRRVQTETGRRRIPQSVVHALLEQRREQEQLRGGPERRLEASKSVRELMTVPSSSTWKGSTTDVGCTRL